MIKSIGIAFELAIKFNIAELNIFSYFEYISATIQWHKCHNPVAYHCCRSYWPFSTQSA